MKKDLRRCAQCRILNHRALLLRIQLTAEGEPVLNGHLFGRSVYLCRHPLCLQRASRNKAIPRSLGNLNPALWQGFCQRLADQI